MAVYNEADFVMQGREVQDPEIAKDELELYYDVKGKKNEDVHKDKLLDMSGQGKDGELTGFDYAGELSGYVGDNGLVFDGIEDTLTMPKLNGVDVNNFTYQLNNNILAFTRDEVKTVKNGNVEVGGRNLFILNQSLWERGAIASANGTNYISDRRIRVIDFLSMESNQDYYLSIHSKHNIGIYAYDEDDNYLGVLGGAVWQTQSTILQSPTGTAKFRMIMMKKDDTEITLGELENVIVKLEKGSVATDWTPAPEDLLETTELKGNILGDMEDIVDASPRDRQSGKEVFTEHVDDSHVHVEVDGQSYQHAGSGKNILHPDELKEYLERYGSGTSLIENGINIVEFEESSMHLKPLLQGKFKENTQYTITLTTKKVIGSNTLYVCAQYTDGTNSDLFTNRIMDNYRTQSGATTPGKTIDFIYFSYGVGGDKTRISLDDAQVEEGSTATEYELPAPAPTPDYPIEIHSLKDVDVVSSVGGRNLLKGTNNFSSNNWSKVGINSTTRITIDGDTAIIDANGSTGELYLEQQVDIDVNTEYTLSSLVRAESVQGSGIRFYIYDGSWKHQNIQATEEWQLFSFTFKPNSSNILILLDSYHNNLGETYFKFPKLEKGNKATDWTPAPEDITPDSNHPLIDKINLNLSEPLRSAGDVKDRIYKDGDGLWKVEWNVGEIVLDGDGDWMLPSWWRVSNNHGAFVLESFESIIGASLESYNLVKSDKFVGVNRHDLAGDNTEGSHIDKEGITQGVDYLALRINIDRLESYDVGAFQNWLRDNPVTAYYYLGNKSYTETLSQDLQGKLNNLRSFQGSNYVYTIQNTDNPHKEQLMPTLHATFNSKDYLKETRTLTNLLIWARELTDEELIHHNKLFLNRFNLPSDRVIGEPIEQTLNLLQGGVVGHSLEQNYTINI